MALSAGTRLGPYEILEPLGAGGMGEVYRARDTRLDRTVAVKVLPAELAADPQLKARFEREARAISALAHPNICTLHDVGEQDGRTFLVMEHLVGQTLAECLRKGPLPLDKALEVATQIADALAAAHKQGIVHRDLKPGNVILTKTGARLLDFGLARLTAHGERPAIESLTSAPTEPEPLTGAGTIMGTLPYMAPEQVEGKPADARTDLWALGVILYEMLTGHRAFEASSAVSLVGAILERDPAPLAEKQPLTPPSLERLVRRCLAKEPDDRWDTAHDLADELRWIAEAGSEAGVLERGRWTQRSMTTALAVVAIAALLAGVLLGRLWPPPSEGSHRTPVIRSHVDLTPERALRREGSLFRSPATELALSPDGTLLVWSGGPEGDPARSALHLRRFDTAEVTRIPGTEGASQPFFSPDGRWIGFISNGWLRKVPVEGGLTVDLAEMGAPVEGAAWSPDGGILLGIGWGLGWVPAEGGTPRPLTTVDESRENDHGFPVVLPGGHALLVTAETNFRDRRVDAVSLASGERKVVVEDGADARYLSTGHLVFARCGVLMAAPFDVDRLELKAQPVPVVADVLQSLSSDGQGKHVVQLAVSESGLLVYASGGVIEAPPADLLLVDESGRAEPLPGFERPLTSGHVRFSPDGQRLASVDLAGSGLLWTFDVERHTFSLLSHEGIAGSPSWSPDGVRLAFAWAKAGPLDLWTLPIDSTSDWERLTEGEGPNWAPSWSPDGRVLAFVRGAPVLGDILLYRFEDRQVIPFLTTRASEVYPEFSPDGRWLAYGSDESGRREIYVTSFPDRKQTLTVSRAGGRAPAWSRDGRRIFYYSLASPGGGRSMMAVEVDLGGSLSLGSPRALFRLPDGFLTATPMRSYELHPDGRRFLLASRPEPDPPPPITRLHVVHNWFEELKRLVPVD